MIDVKKMQGELRAHFSAAHGALYWIGSKPVSEREWTQACKEHYGPVFGKPALQ